MSMNLGITGAYNRTRTLSPISHNDDKPHKGKSSATYSHLEKEAKHIKAENSKLKAELDETRTALKQLISETSHEKFDERRINLLKLQMIQLERQIAMLNEALGARQTAVMEVENTLAWLADKFRSYISADVKGPQVPIARSDLTSMVEVTESARIKLFKAVENCNKESVGKELLFMNPFLGGKHKPGEPLTLLDIALERMDCVNLRHVAQLESKLSLLYKELTRLHEEFQSTKERPLLSQHRCRAERERTETMLLKTCALMKDAADDLLALSLLCPSSPWPALKRPVTRDIPVERVLDALPPLPRGKQEEVTHVIQSTVQTCKHRQLLLEKEKTVLKEELLFHRSVYDLQMQYTKALFDAVRTGYGTFEDSAKKVICEPVKYLLDAYKRLKNSASEDALRDFLIMMKGNEQQLMSVVEMFSDWDFDRDENGSAIFSKFGEEFMEKIDTLVIKCQKERDSALERKKELKKEQECIDLELQHVLEELEAKYDKVWTPKPTAASSAIQDSTLLSERAIHNLDDRTTSCNSKVAFQLGNISDVKTSSVCSKCDSKLQGDDPTILRSYLYDDGSDNTEVSDCRSGNQSSKNKSNMKKKWVSDFCLSARSEDGVKQGSRADSSRTTETTRSHRWQSCKDWDSDFTGVSQPVQKATVATSSDKRRWQPEKEWNNDFTGISQPVEKASGVTSNDKSRRWQPDKEWNNDFMGTPSPSVTQTTTPRPCASGLDSAKTNSLKYYQAHSEQLKTGVTEIKRPPPVARKPINKEKKLPPAYEANVQVAQRTLRLKQSGSSGGVTKDVSPKIVHDHILP